MSGSITFNAIPSEIRVPLFIAEVDNSRASYYTQNLKTLLIGQSVNTIVEEPALITSVNQAKTLYGNGSMLARMVDVYKKNDSFGELWVMPLNDVVGTKAVGTVTFTGPASASGTVYLYIAGVQIQVPIANGADETDIALAVDTKINDTVDLPVTSTYVLGVVTLTAKNVGTLGNDINIAVNYFPDFESLPGGTTATVVAMTTGATDPTLSTAITAIGDAEFEYWVQPFTDTNNLDLLEAELASRWGPMEMLYGHTFAAINDTVSGLATAGALRNDQHTTIVGYYDSPTWQVEVAAAYAAQAAAHLNVDPARPLQTLTIQGIVTPKTSSHMTITEKQTLLFSGIAPLYYEGGITRIVRAITTYQKDTFGSPDASYLDVNTLSTLALITRTVRNMVQTKFARVKLADDGTSFGAGQAIVTPKIVKGEIIALYDALVFKGIAENAEKFAEELIVARDNSDPNRLNVLMVPDLVNPLHIFGLKNEFVLQFAE